MNEFDLRAHIRAALAETTEENLYTLTELILKGIPKRAYAEALAQALPEVVRKELATAPRAATEDSRFGHLEAGTHTRNAEPGNNSASEGQATSEPHRPSTPTGGQNTRNSRASIFRRNRFRISVWIGQGNYRPILDCTVAELEFAAEESHRQAEANAATERKYRRLVKKMIQRQAEKVADLTDAEIEEALTDA